MCLGWMDSQAEFENLKFKPTGIFIDGSAVVALQSMLQALLNCKGVTCLYISDL